MLFDQKIVYKKGTLCVVAYSIYQHHKQKGGISVGIIRSEINLPFDLDVSHEIKVFPPGKIAKLFGSTMERRIQKAIEKSKNRIDQVLKQDAKERHIEDQQNNLMQSYLDKVPGEKEDGMKRAHWHAVLNKPDLKR